MSNTEINPAQLIALAKVALAAGDPETESLAIEGYCKLFDLWLKAQGGVIAPVDQNSRPALQQLSDLHAEVLARAEVLLSSTSKGLQELKRKSKGIRAYLDILPKKISVTGSRKG